MLLPELLIRPDLGKRAYRLRCRFATGAYPQPEWLEKTKYKVAEMWVEDMRKQGWEYDPGRLEKRLRGFTIKGPFKSTPITGAPNRQERSHFNAAAALPRIVAGDRMRLPDLGYVATLPSLEESDKWEYELSAIFIRQTILVETADLHEEKSVR